MKSYKVTLYNDFSGPFWIVSAESSKDAIKTIADSTDLCIDELDAKALT